MTEQDRLVFQQCLLLYRKDSALKSVCTTEVILFFLVVELHLNSSCTSFTAGIISLPLFLCAYRTCTQIPAPELASST